MKRYIGIDQSLSCTAICILNNIDTKPKFIVFHKAKAGKWHKTLDMLTTFKQITYSTYPKSHTKSELLKLTDYLKITTDIISTLEISETDTVAIEGYAMRSKGNVADLFAFGTLLRERIYLKTTKLVVIPPMSLKVNFASLIYEADKKGVYRNSAGIAAGSFSKTEMLQGLFDMAEPNLLQEHLHEYKEDLLSLKNVPGPINDCVDAYAAALLIKNKDRDV